MKTRYFLLLAFLVPATQVFNQQSADLYDTDAITTIAITFSNGNWRYQLDSLRYNGDELLEATVQINGKSYDQAGVRYRDAEGFTPNRMRNSLFIKLDHNKSGSNYQGYRTLNLSSALRDPSMIREVVSYEIARRYFPAPRANYANVTINDTLYGLFVNVEPMAGGFLERNGAASDGTFIKAHPNKSTSPSDGCLKGIYSSLKADGRTSCYEDHFQLLSSSGWFDLQQLIEVLNRRPTDLESVLDVDRVLWVLAFNNVLVSLDSYLGRYSDNYYLYQGGDERFAMGLGAMNFGFGSYKNTGDGSDLKIKALLQLDPFLHQNNEGKPLVASLLKNEQYLKQYLAHVRTLLQEEFRGDKFELRVTQFQDFIRPYRKADPNPDYTFEEFENGLVYTHGRKIKIPGLLAFMDERSEFLKRHPQLMEIPPTVEEVEVLGRERFARAKVEDFKVQARVTYNPSMVYIYYRFDPNESYRRKVMVDNGKSNDREARDDWYGTQLDPPSNAATMEYFIVASNARTLSYHPARYMYEPYKISLSELNR